MAILMLWTDKKNSLYTLQTRAVHYI